MTYHISKKKSLFDTLYNFWFSTKISLLVEFLALGLGLIFYFQGHQKNIFLVRLSIVIFAGSIAYAVYLLTLFICMMIQFVRKKQTQELTLDILENNELHFKYDKIDCIVDKSKIKWVREHKNKIYFFLKPHQRLQIAVSLEKPIEEGIKDFILSCRETKGIKQPVSFVVIYFLFLAFGLILTTLSTTYHIDTDDKQIYEYFQEKQPIQILDDLYPSDLNSYTPLSQKYYYYNKKYLVFPTNPPILGFITFVYTPKDYETVREKLQTVYQKSDWVQSYKGTTFYIHPKFLDSNTYGFIGYNEKENRIIFFVYEDGYISSINLLESDFETVISKYYSKICTIN